jgi:hypothetical protein
VHSDTDAGLNFERNGLPQGKLIGLTEDGRPLFCGEFNRNAAISTATDQVRDMPAIGVDGEGYTVGIWDGGAIHTTHAEFGSRVTIIDGASLSSHATHVGGTIGASGVEPDAKGVAPKVALDSYDFNQDTAEMALVAATTGFIVEAVLSGTTPSLTYQFQAHGNTPFKATISWTDPASSAIFRSARRRQQPAPCLSRCM